MANLLIKLAVAAVDTSIRALKVNYTWKQVFDRVVDIIGPVAGAVAFIYLIYSGFLYLTAAGNPDNAKKGQQGIINAIIGIAIILGGWTIIKVIINTINQAF
jgi:type IV secretory pathway VirB2 component (pilin)